MVLAMEEGAINQGLDEGLFKVLLRTVQEMPALKNLNISLKRISPGRVVFEMDIGPGYSNTIGTAHGGVIASLADTAMGYAGISLDQMLVTLEMNLNYFATVKVGERVIAEAEVIYAGKKTVVAEAGIYDSRRRLVAKSRGTYSPVGRLTEIGPGLLSR
ncbi:MAG: PaaI family thioesterase [Firmicutes bacterium]|nr:PaaI family thioesterase [Bacillota bacterium]